MWACSVYSKPGRITRRGGWTRPPHLPTSIADRPPDGDFWLTKATPAVSVARRYSLCARTQRTDYRHCKAGGTPSRFLYFRRLGGTLSVHGRPRISMAESGSSLPMLVPSRIRVDHARRLVSYLGGTQIGTGRVNGAPRKTLEAELQGRDCTGHAGP